MPKPCDLQTLFSMPKKFVLLSPRSGLRNAVMARSVQKSAAEIGKHCFAMPSGFIRRLAAPRFPMKCRSWPSTRPTPPICWASGNAKKNRKRSVSIKKNKRRHGAQPEMKSLFKGYGEVASSSKTGARLGALFSTFDGKRHCLLVQCNREQYILARKKRTGLYPKRSRISIEKKAGQKVAGVHSLPMHLCPALRYYVVYLGIILLAEWCQACILIGDSLIFIR